MPHLVERVTMLDRFADAGLPEVMDLVTAWKASSIVLTGAFGILGLVKDFKEKDSKKITVWGRVSLAGILVSTVCGLAAQLKESADSERDKQSISKQTLALVTSADASLRGIERLLTPLDVTEVTASFDASCARQDMAKFCEVIQSFRSKSAFESKNAFLYWPLRQRPVLRMTIAFFTKSIDREHYDVMTDSRGDWSIDTAGDPDNLYAHIAAVPTRDGVEVTLDNRYTDTLAISSKGIMSSVADIAGTTVLVTLYNEAQRYLTLKSFAIKCKNGQVISASGFEAATTLTGSPAFRYFFSKN